MLAVSGDGEAVQSDGLAVYRCLLQMDDGLVAVTRYHLRPDALAGASSRAVLRPGSDADHGDLAIPCCASYVPRIAGQDRHGAGW